MKGSKVLNGLLNEEYDEDQTERGRENLRPVKETRRTMKGKMISGREIGAIIYVVRSELAWNGNLLVLPLSLSLLSLKRLVDIVSRIARARCWLNAAKTMPCTNDHDTQGTRLSRSSAFSFILHLGDFRLHVHIYMYIRLSHRPTSSSERGRIFFRGDRTWMRTNELDITRTRDTSFTSPTDSK